MAAIINYAITNKAFEVVRDLLGQILIDEITQQATLQPSEPALQNVRVFPEMSVPPGTEILPCVIVGYAASTFDNWASPIGDADENTRFYIDVWTKAKASGATPEKTRGDQTALLRNQRLQGVILGILQDAQYAQLNTQDSPDILVQRQHVKTLAMAEYDKKQEDMQFSAMSRMILEIDVQEKSPGVYGGVPLTRVETRANVDGSGVILEYFVDL